MSETLYGGTSTRRITIRDLQNAKLPVTAGRC